MRPHTLIFCALIGFILAACGGARGTPAVIPPTPSRAAEAASLERETKIPPGAVKMSPETDAQPPVLLSDEYEEPVPIPGAVNTAGGEDSPFITPDGDTLYFFFTPDVNVPVEKQISDGVTGIYVSQKDGGGWGKPERVMLQDPGKLALDGCEFILGDTMWFCTAREGESGIHWYTAEFRAGRWQAWRNAEFDPAYQVGELHISGDGAALYFHSARAGGQGGLDIWMSAGSGGEWQTPTNLAAVNSAENEGWPALSPDGSELWFYRNYGVWRSRQVNGEWQAAEQILSSLAGEPSLDGDGNIYFVHHFFEGDQMIEADIYVAYKK